MDEVKELINDNPFSKKVKPLYENEDVKVKDLGNRNEDPLRDSELINNIGIGML